MEVTELRLGNWVKIDRGYCKVVALNTPAYSEWNKGDDYCIVVQALNGCFWECTEDEVNGIVLTDKLIDSINEIIADDKANKGSQDRRIYFVDESKGVEVNCVHEIQNAHYTNSKRELNLDSLFKQCPSQL